MQAILAVLCPKFKKKKGNKKEERKKENSPVI